MRALPPTPHRPSEGYGRAVRHPAVFKHKRWAYCISRTLYSPIRLKKSLLNACRMWRASEFHQAPRPFTELFHALWGAMPLLIRFRSRVLGFFHAIQMSLRKCLLTWMSSSSKVPLRSSSLKYCLHPRRTGFSFAMVARREVPRAWKKMSFSPQLPSICYPLEGG